MSSLIERQILNLVSDLNARFGEKFSLSTAEFELLGKTYYHCSSTVLGATKSVTGHGRGEVLPIALTKSIYELIERLWMLKPYVSRPTFQAEWVNGRSLARFAQPSLQLAPNYLSSNGWGAHQTAELAVRAALFEAIERHILQVGFLNSGFRGWRLCQTHVVDGFKISLWEVPCPFAGLSVRVGCAEGPQFPGLVFGHACSPTDEDSWNRVLIETLQAAHVSSYNVAQPDNAKTLFERIDLSSALSTSLRQRLWQESHETTSPPVEPLSFSYQVIDVTEEWKMSAPVHVAFAWSEQLMPLYLAERHRDWDHSIFAKHVARPVTEIQQTPFV